MQSWHSTATTMRLEASEALAARSVIRRTVAVSLLNPHAILDTVGVIGSAVAAQADTSRMLFAGGAVSASWIWFLFLAGGAAAMRRYLTPKRALWFERISGIVMLLSAVILLQEFIQLIST